MISIDKKEGSLKNLAKLKLLLSNSKYLEDWTIQVQKAKATVEYTVVLKILKNINLVKLFILLPDTTKLWHFNELESKMEVETGIGPIYKDLQSSA